MRTFSCKTCCLRLDGGGREQVLIKLRIIRIKLIHRLKKSTRNLSRNVWFPGLCLNLGPCEQKASDCHSTETFGCTSGYSMQQSASPGMDTSPHFQDFLRFSKTKVPIPDQQLAAVNKSNRPYRFATISSKIHKNINFPPQLVSQVYLFQSRITNEIQ